MGRKHVILESGIRDRLCGVVHFWEILIFVGRHQQYSGVGRQASPAAGTGIATYILILPGETLKSMIGLCG